MSVGRFPEQQLTEELSGPCDSDCGRTLTQDSIDTFSIAKRATATCEDCSHHANIYCK